MMNVSGRHGFTHWVGAMLAAVLALTAGVARAGIVLGIQDWDTAPADAIIPEPGSHWDEIIDRPAADLYVGAWNMDLWIAFDFWAETSTPATLQMSGFGLASEPAWHHALAGATIGQWTRFTAPLSNWEAWQSNPFGDVNDFLNDLESINWIGIYIERDGYQDPGIYGIDDFALMVPEPAEIVLLLAGIAAAGWVVRKRRPATALATAAA